MKIFSFDVFDTVVTRNVYRPSDVFLFLPAMFDRSGLSLPAGLINDFKNKRQKAEFVARLRARNEDITANDVYAVIASEYGLDGDTVNKMVAVEIEAELEYSTPIAATVELVGSARRAADRVIFVSDMYLPSFVIKKMLQKAGVYNEGDEIFVSGEIGVSKRTGGLFRHIFQKFGCKPGEITHFGDDIYSDVYIPYKLGIDVYGADKPEMRRVVLAQWGKGVMSDVFDILRKILSRQRGKEVC